MEVLRWLESTSLSEWILSSGSLWSYPTILFLHTMGLTAVVGVNTAVNLRLLGFAPDVRLAPLSRLFPIMWAAFAVNAISGTMLLVADATTKLANPVFYYKMVCIGLALVILRLLKTRVFDDPRVDQQPVSTYAKLLAASSLILWIGAITAGRLMAYIGPVSGLQ